MASEAPSPPPSPSSSPLSPPTSPEPELAHLRRKVEKLERELRSCKRQVREIERLLHHTERLYQSAESNNQELRTQVEELSKILHCGRNEDKSDVEVQTENHTPWSISDYYYQTYYKDVSLPDKATELSVQQGQDLEASTFNPEEHSQIENDAYTGTDITKNDKCGQEEHFTSNSQEPASALANEDTSLEGLSLAESLRAAAEAAVSQTGFSYDENTGLYFDHSTGFYYDSENQLYYDPSTGIYYYCDVESGRYQFHSRVDLQSYQTSSMKQSKDKKLKKKRKDPDSSTTNEEKDLNSEDQKTSIVEHINCNEGDFASVKKKAKIDIHYKNSPPKFTIPVSGSTVESPHKENIYNLTSFKDEKIIETDSEPEEGEITDSQTEDSYDEDITSEDNVTPEDTEDEGDEEKIWPPCIRVIVIRSPVLQTGSLFIITAVNPATIGREKDMEHTLRIPEVGVSKFHAEIYFDHDLQSYVLVDQGSQNGTVVNGKQILQPKTKCDPYVLEHGDEVKIGETVLSFHIHPGSDTCDGCEPGQVRAHLRLDKKDESIVGPTLSKEEKELERRKELKKIRVKYGLQNTDYEDEKALKNPKYKDRAGKRREQIGSEGTFQRDDAPASVHSEITDSNKGRKMLEKMGWKKGEGLGKDGGGMKTPIQLQLRRTHAGLGTGKPSSIEDVHLLQNKSKKNWDKARERFAENFPETKPQKDAPGTMPWVKGTTE
ncbi:angiogenic factor with G patch and FHA domains 1 [Dasypus novemcinctus]|uniref:angiogenic factor with G patch and FHA domains 1 n=1 Tax=Dasypus novemcinctus TaxID=9361 RepID=UPI0003288C25|nr:angiogenic factor with G patch and FHA domains 1 [Dasypus novemcinctus]